jgi:hypothetical protein
MGNSVRLTAPLLLPGGSVASATVPTAGGCPPSKSRNLMSAWVLFPDSPIPSPEMCLYDWAFQAAVPLGEARPPSSALSPTSARGPGFTAPASPCGEGFRSAPPVTPPYSDLFHVARTSPG